MYPRLYLARNLLREDGAIFISIDDGEVDNLRKVCNEVFGARIIRRVNKEKYVLPVNPMIW
jgi:adenine-specific DNA-methyltransferase